MNNTFNIYDLKDKTPEQLNVIAEIYLDKINENLELLNHLYFNTGKDSQVKIATIIAEFSKKLNK